MSQIVVIAKTTKHNQHLLQEIKNQLNIVMSYISFINKVDEDDIATFIFNHSNAVSMESVRDTLRYKTLYKSNAMNILEAIDILNKEDVIDLTDETLA